MTYDRSPTAIGPEQAGPQATFFDTMNELGTFWLRAEQHLHYAVASEFGLDQSAADHIQTEVTKIDKQMIAPSLADITTLAAFYNGTGTADLAALARNRLLSNLGLYAAARQTLQELFAPHVETIQESNLQNTAEGLQVRSLAVAEAADRERHAEQQTARAFYNLVDSGVGNLVAIAQNAAVAGQLPVADTLQAWADSYLHGARSVNSMLEGLAQLRALLTQMGGQAQAVLHYAGFVRQTLPTLQTWLNGVISGAPRPAQASANLGVLDLPL